MIFSKSGSNSTVSFVPWSLPFKYHLIFLFYLPFSFSFLPFLFSLPFILSPPPILISFILLLSSLPFFLLQDVCQQQLFKLKRNEKGHQCCQDYQYCLLSLEKVTCTPVIMESDAPTHPLLLSLSLKHPEIMRVFHIKKLYQTVSQCHGYYHVVRNYSIAHMLLKSLGSLDQ